MSGIEVLTNSLCVAVGFYVLWAFIWQMAAYTDLAVWHHEEHVLDGVFGSVIHAAFGTLMFMDISLLQKDFLVTPTIDFAIMLSCIAIIVVFAIPVAKFWNSVIKYDIEFHKFCKSHQNY